MKTQTSDQAKNNLFMLWNYANKRRKMQFFMLIFLAFIMSIAELATIGAVIPFIGVLLSPEQVFYNPVFTPVILFLDIEAPSELIFPLCLGFGLICLSSTLIRLFQLYANAKFSLGFGSELATDIFTRILYQNYEYHANKNSSEFINSVVNKTTLLMHNIILGTINIIGGTILILIVVIGLISLQPMLAFISFGVLGSLYISIAFLAKNFHKTLSDTLDTNSTSVIKIIQESLGAIRDVIIGKNQLEYAATYKSSDIRLRGAQAWSLFITASPRYLVEGMALLFISIGCYFVASNGDVEISNSIPIFAALALGAQRLLPIMQQIFNAFSGLRINNFALVDCIELLKNPLPDKIDVNTQNELFNNQISFDEVSFKYINTTNLVLKNISIEINKGMRIGIIGKTGSGKSTLLDMLMGLLKPSSGAIKIDDVVLSESNNSFWQSKLAHVPQSIFLIDGTIAQNIALNSINTNIDLDRVILCSKIAKIDQTINNLDGKYDAQVGERGIKLSGGQRQRIGIARALYKKADVIILDEATSSLDNETEAEVMESIENHFPDLTYIIVAHRLSTLKNCDEIIHLSNGIIKDIGTFDKVIKNIEN